MFLRSVRSMPVKLMESTGRAINLSYIDAIDPKSQMIEVACCTSKRGQACRYIRRGSAGADVKALLEEPVVIGRVSGLS